MHELSVTENVLEIALKHAEASKAQKVIRVNLVIGQLSSIIDDSVQFYWDSITEGTLCANSELTFRRLPAVFHCLKCGSRFNLSAELTICPQCKNDKTEMISGDEFYVDSIEIEKEE
jgi:hydrogenase nickel incorporation protein HypA/HybF